MTKKKEQKEKEISQEKKETQDQNSDKERIEELTIALQRLQAEFENYKKRTEKESADFKNFAEENMIRSLLPVIDNFELAFQNKPKDQKSPTEFLKGVELIYAQLFGILEEKGVKEIKSLGEKFNPYKHEALLTEKTDKEENTIIEVLQKGYMLGDKVLRCAKVKIAK